MIFNMTGGGGTGAGLNFKVVGGTTQPSNPSENTIWVNTDKEITGWIFSAKNPFIGEIVESAGVLSGTVGTSALNQTGYSFRKVNDGKAVVAFFNSSSSVGVILVSRDRDACKISKVPILTTIDTTTTIEAENSFIYDGETYYYAYFLFNKDMYYILDVEPIDCTSYTVLANALAPTYNIDNKVWIKSGEISTVSFNALKKNGIMIYPSSAKQFISGTWESVTAKSFHGGQWADWMIYLYNKGAEYVDESGNGWAFSGKYTKNEQSIRVGTTGGTAFSGYAESPFVDLSGFDTIDIHIITFTTSGLECYGTLYVIDEGGATVIEHSLTRGMADDSLVNIDVSSINSRCKFRVTAGHTRTGSGRSSYIDFDVVRCY